MTLRHLWLMALRRLWPYLVFPALWGAIAAILGLGLLGLVAGEALILVVLLVAAVRRHGWPWGGNGQTRASMRMTWPLVPWGLDLVSVMAGIAVGLATEWWIGIAAWVLITVLWWAGWIWTRRYMRPDDPSSARIDRLVNLTMWPLLGALWVVVLIQATVDWGDVGFLATALGLGAYAFLLERFVRLRERDRPVD